MKLAIFTHQYLPRIGGVQVLIQNLIHFLLEESEHEILLIAPHYESQTPPVEKKGRLTIHRPFNPEKKLSVLKALLAFPKLLRDEAPDIVHGQDTLIDGLFCRYACPKVGIPFLLSTQGELNPFKRAHIPWSTRGKTPYLRWVFRASRAIITPEPTIMEKLKHHVGLGEQYRYIPNAIYVTQEQSKSSDSDEPRLRELDLKSNQFFLFLGRLIPEKGVYEIIEAISMISSEMREKNFHFFFSGTGSAEEALKKETSSKGLEDLILYSNHILPNDKWVLLRHCRSMVLPSWEENLPISILESFGLETPIIGSDIPEIEALMPTPAVGKTFKRKNSKDLARCLQEDMASSAEKASKDFKRAMAPYDLRQMGAQLLNLYEGLPSPK